MKITYENKSVILPDFLIVGAAKSGTTSLFNYLGQHPEINLPEIKEPWFFSYFGDESSILNSRSGDRVKQSLVLNPDAYFQLFSKLKNSCITGEASTCYLYLHERTIKNIRQFYGDDFRSVKIVIVLRNPVDRAWSNYQMHKRDGTEDMDLQTAMLPESYRKRESENFGIYYDYIGFGQYYEQVKAFKENFPEVKIILYDDLLQQPDAVLKDLFEFLGVDGSIPVDTDVMYNISGTPKNALAAWIVNFIYPPNRLKAILKYLLPTNFRMFLRVRLSEVLLKRKNIPEEGKKVLQDVFKGNIVQLSKEINRDLSFWML